MTNILSSTSTNRNTFSKQSHYQQQQTKIPQSNITMKWIRVNSLPMPVAYSQATVIKDKVYLFGGHNSSGQLSTVLTAPINENGEVWEWTIDSQLPIATSDAQIIITKNRIYLISGIAIHNYSDSISIYTSNIYTATINNDGTIGEWIKSNPLPISSIYGKIIVIKDKVYVFGGYDSQKGYLSTIFTSSIDEDGKLGEWVFSGTMPNKISHSQIIVIKDRIYLLGGRTRFGSLSTAFTTTINENGELRKWETDRLLPATFIYSQATIIKDKVYLFGGYYDYNCRNVISSTFMAPINDNGELGQWMIGPSMPKDIYNTQLVTIKDKVYLLGGYSSDGYLSDVYIASIKHD